MSSCPRPLERRLTAHENFSDARTHYTRGVDRLNPEGIPRKQLAFVLTQPRRVLEARRIDACLLCRREGVNAAALCEVCYAMLDGEEQSLATRWTSGGGP